MVRVGQPWPGATTAMLLLMALCCSAISSSSIGAKSSTIPTAQPPSQPLCRCTNPAHCNPISPNDSSTRKELLAFHPGGEDSTWQYYNWTHLTTISTVTEKIDEELVCYAHARNVRVVHRVPFSPDVLANASSRGSFINNAVNFLVQHRLDGINIDFESPIQTGRTSLRQNLTLFIQDLRSAMDKHYAQFGPHAGQLSFDTFTNPDSHWWHFDYKSISEHIDFFVMMDYDGGGCEWGTVRPGHYTCIAGPNSAIAALSYIPRWIEVVGNDTNKLVVATPWYGHTYECILGGNSSSPVGVSNTTKDCYNVGPWTLPNLELGFEELMRIIRGTLPGVVRTTEVFTNLTQSSVHFNYWHEERHAVYQAWFDTPETLLQKYNYVKSFNLRGLSMWNADELAYGNSTTPAEQHDTAVMWTAIGSFFD